MKSKIISHMSNGFLIAGVLTGLYAVTDILVSRSRLPAGTCPVSSNRPLLFAAIAFCCISFFLSFFEGKKSREDRKTE